MPNISENNVLLELRDMTKRFGSVTALDHVSLTVKKGSVHALMGENGAGKSTLMKCLFGIYAPDGGEILLDGRKLHISSPKEALSAGIAMVHQELNQAGKRSVADNIWLGRYPKRLGFVREREIQKRSLEIFRELGISLDPRAEIGTLSVAKRQMVEIAKAVSYGARVIVLDEPTSSLSDVEVEHLFRIIKTLQERGCGIIYISHKMEEILRISDEITVMRDGKNVRTAPAAALNMDTIIKLMVGRDLTDRFPEKAPVSTDIIFQVEHLSSRHTHVKDVSFFLRRGEILGLAGLAGAGRSELLENIFGIAAREGGRLYLGGREIRNKTPGEAIANGFAFVTEERRATGIFGVLDILENTTVSALHSYSTGGFYLNDKKRKSATDKMIRELSVKTASRETKIRTLSGGNQQKVIFARWLLTDPLVLLLDEPTRGIDVGAKYEIYRLMQELAAKGRSMIIVSSELPELLGVCHRICVMSDGEITGIVNADETTQEEIMKLASKNV